MKYKSTSFLFFICFVFILGTGCKSTDITVSQKDYIPELRQDVTTLASDEMEGREVGTKGEIAAAEYIAKRYEAIGLTPKGGKDSYFQIFKRKMKSNPHAEKPAEDDPEIEGRNVVGFMDFGADHTIVIGAHYDHLGYGNEGSLHAGERAIHNGADDNASGVAAMIALADILKSGQYNRSNYLFIAFSGEEKGLWGSKYFVQNPTIELSSVNYMMNMDMIGRLNTERQLAIHGTGTSTVWDQILDGIKKPVFKVKKDASGIGPSDHTSFYLENIPVLHFFTGQHKQYHRPEDDVELINFEGINDVVNYLATIIAQTDKMPKLTYVKTKDDSAPAPSFKVTLGVIPDYLFDGKGMRIDGVRDGRPAHKADMVRGDIVVKMGDKEVIDMMSYMKCLSSFSPGETINVVIKREDREMTKKVTFD